ncbi:MAG: RagB/SusD family nutrient uptake outer membrane protein [Mangrovibacterium sp.]
MKRGFYYMLVTLSALIMSGCDDFLDIVPKDKFIPTTMEEYENMLNNATVILYSDYNIDLMTDDAYLPEGNESAVPAQPNLYTRLTIPVRKIYTFDPEPFTEADNDFAWSEGYKRLFYFNTVINNVLNSEGDDQQKKASIRAEALLQRAIEHFTLVNIYAHHYDEATAVSEPGIPLALEADISAKFRRNTVMEVYTQILEDITEALPNLPETPAITKFRASRAGGLAMFSKVYFYMGDYVKALDYANQALQAYGTLADMNQYRITIPGPPGFSGSPVEWTNIPRAQNHPESILARTFLRPFGLGQSVCPTPELQNLFDRSNDMRWEFWYRDGWPPNQNYWNMFGVRIHLRGDYFNNCLTTPEIYLIRAECHARTNNLNGALDDINLLRRNRLKPAAYVAFTAGDFGNDAERVLRFVLEERRREMAFKGVRHMDLKRLNKDPRFAKTITHVAEGVQYTLEPNSSKYLRQLWPAATIFNPDWELNPAE